MTREDIFKGTQDIFRDIFGEDDIVIQDSTTSDDIEEWDSLNHINLVSAIEKEYKIKFALGELQSMKDVGMLIDLIQSKL